MKTPRATVLALSSIMLIALAGRAAAQDRGAAGISMGYPANIGFVFHVSEPFALRPEISFSRSTTDQDTSFADIRSETSTFDIGISGIHYIGRWDKLRIYLSPGYSYRRAKGTFSTDNVVETDSTSATAHIFRGSFGTQSRASRTAQRLWRGRPAIHGSTDQVGSLAARE